MLLKREGRSVWEPVLREWRFDWRGVSKMLIVLLKSSVNYCRVETSVDRYSATKSKSDFPV